MNKLWQRRLHGGARACGWTVGVGVIVLAVLVALTQLLLPLLARHPAWVAAQLSQRLQRNVSFTSLEGRWTPSGPLFVMRNVTVGAAAGERGNVLQVPQAEMKLDFGGWLLPSRRVLNIYVRGLRLDLTRDASGAWHVNGLGVAGAGQTRQPLSLGPLSMDLWLDNLQIAVTDAALGKQYTLQARQLRLNREGSHIRFGGTLVRAGEAAMLRTSGRFREDGSAGHLWIGIDHVDLKPLLAGIAMDGYTAEQGAGRIAAWLDWDKGRVSNSVIRFDLDRLAVAAPGGAVARVSSLHGLAGLRRSADGYLLRWAGDDGSALALSLHRPGTAQAGIGVAARDLQLAPLLPWLALKPALAPAIAQWLGSGRPRGELTRVALRWQLPAGLQALDVTFKDLAIDPVGKLPGIGPLQGEALGDAQALSLQLPPQAATLQLPQMFRQPFVLSRLGGTLAFWPQPQGWQLGVDALDFSGAGYAGQLRGEITLPAGGGKPFLDLYASLDHADVTAAKLFWPINAMSPATIGWLDRALVGGSVDQAQVLVRGDLADWPFRHNEGRFEARAVLSGLQLDYARDWPRADGISAVASFIDNGMLVQASGGQSLGVKADSAVALIPDFADGLLDLNVQGSGKGADLMDFVAKSPIGNRQADTLAKLHLGGSGSFGFHLVLPLKDAASGQLTGSAQLQDASLTAPDWNLELDQLSGPLQFTGKGMQAGPLNALVHGQPSTLQLALAGANSDPATVLSAQLQGRYAFAELVQGYPSLAWLGQAAEGRSDFTVGFTIAHVPGSDAMAQTLSLDSSLQGLALKLPAPLDKPAAASLPLHLAMSLPTAGGDVQFGLGGLLQGHLRLPPDAQHGLAGTLALGSAMPADVPAQGLAVRGHAARLDVTGWVQQVVGGAGGNGPGLQGIDVDTDQAQLFGYPFGAMKIRVTPQPAALAIAADGPALAGTFSVPTQDLAKRGITAQLQRLYWPKDPHASDKPAKPAMPPANPANTGVNPAALPPFHLVVNDLRMGDARLGEARLETWPTAKGMRIEELRALSPQVQVTASGDWNGSATDSRTHMKIAFAAEDLGAMLSAFGYEGMVNGGKTRDQLDASWPGAPSALSLANMDGTLSIHVSDGRIPEVASPGVGRLLGLVSLADLPRRLTLDFGDVFGKGLGFDTIAGDFQLADGNATTGNLVIRGPSANISISGRTGLRARDYDQLVQVVPHIGNSLPVVGAVVGGPIGAAAGLAVQGLLGKGLNHAATARYTVTGSWDKPVMTLVEKHGAPPSAALLAPAATTMAPPTSILAPAAAGSTAMPAAASSTHR